MIKKQNVLVLGSKISSKLPAIEVSKIYTANGAAQKTKYYKEQNKNIFHTAIVGGKYIIEFEDEKQRVIQSRPNKLIVRSGPIEIPEEFKLYECQIIQLTKKEDFKIQSKFYKLGFLDLMYGEVIHYETDLIQRLKHIYACINHKGFMGYSTGLMTVLMAIYENPNSNIFVSGIGLVEGARFFENEKDYGYVSKKKTQLVNKKKIILKNKYNNTSRFRVDRYLAKSLKNIYKRKVVSLDKDFVNNAFGSLWEGKILKDNQ
tara:strand:+ start:2529 stop:3308 length:780 start_codon:yes stop_codon:yes gene_type:complete